MKRAIRFASVAFALASAAIPVMIAGPLEDGIEAHENGDFATALRLLRPLADQGNATAQLNLGFIYANGEGVPRDYVQAHKWLNLGASAFPATDAHLREVAVKYRDEEANKMTPVQIAEAQRLASQWKPAKPK